MRRDSVMTNTGAMDKDNKPTRTPNVLKKFNRESLDILERGLLGELPQKLRPQNLVRAEKTRSRRSELVIEKQSGFISSCLAPIHDSTDVERSSEDEDSISPLKKSFSFREKFSRMNFFGKDKEKMDKNKLKKVEEHKRASVNSSGSSISSMERETKSKKRFWLFRNKDLEENKGKHRPAYTRSKSFECLPRPAEDEENDFSEFKELKKNSQSFVCSNDALDGWIGVSYDNDEGVFLKSVKEFPSLESSYTNSSISTVTSNSSGIVVNLLKSESMQDVLNEFDKTVDMFSENYMSDSEPYTKCKDLSIEEKRRSSSFSVMPSPKIMQTNKVSEVSEDFKKELSEMLSVKQSNRTSRRGSVTDWFVLEDQKVFVSSGNEAKGRRRTFKKPMNRVRRMSSTKYVSTQSFAIYN